MNCSIVIVHRKALSVPSSSITQKFHTVDVKGVQTRYFDDGQDKDPILLIHGGHFGFFIPVGIESWGNVLEDFGEYGRVLAVDKLGQGETGLPLNDEDWTVDAVAEHVANFATQLGLKNLTLVGHSRGGMTAVLLALKYPEMVKKLVIISSATAAPAPPVGTDMDFYERVERTAPGGSAELIRHYHAAQAVNEGDLPEDYIGIATKWLESEKQLDAVAGYARNAEEHWLPSLSEGRRWVQERLADAGIPVPTLVVWGVNDRSAPVSMGKGLFDLIAANTLDSSLYLINNAGHHVFSDQREKFNAAVGAFISL
ncbi:alpha/beta hydrolase fold protein [Mycobacteroides abscessus]|jgi:pimeloyl-ACP methyl ester carboxylesterase|uniref:Monoethylhexylphthalate hydrolase n=3 Tax=Mycobacteriales TaxID=85007 RepID=Q2MHH5_9ACTN|nr:alpha/beta hydrolase fold protein [Mycobacteroides abscessus]SKK65594.1 alpha/beta hydrolase fold protein [Mycobacteroides abscessus subsp. massiliense]BAE78500.1 monoethylhexylphthalate hydrolase [Gordonia sp. P8219]CPU62706.1 alpha/beta hydrolase fold protein [Mycobacteroides abscessus]SKQ34925.1 alpha/beta hydrolase fold protein [Mycobacteroides abscessus subsp. massiliense]